MSENSPNLFLEIFSTDVQLYQAADGVPGARQYAEHTGAKFNVYFILEYNRLRLKPASLVIDAKTLIGEFTVEGPHPKDYEFELPHDFGNGCVASSPYPHNLLLVEKGGEMKLEAKLPLLSRWIRTTYKELSSFQVVYIGQAQGRDRERDSITRLEKHETLAQILAHNDQFKPHVEVWLLTFAIDANAALITNAGASDFESSVMYANEGATQLLRDRKTLVNLMEGGFIRYFGPEYNQNFALNFPDPNHKSYSAAFTHVKQLIMRLDTTSPLNIATSSETVRPSALHMVEYAFDSNAKYSTLSDYLTSLFSKSDDP